MKVASISAVPVSRVEAREIVGGDYLADTLMKDDWAYVVRFGAEGSSSLAEGIPLPVHITTENIAPITLVFGGTA